MNSNVILEVLGFQKEYWDNLKKKAVNAFTKPITFKVMETDFLVILGASGSGKSTLFEGLVGARAYEGFVNCKVNKSVLFTENQLDLHQSMEDNFMNYYSLFKIKHHPLNEIKTFVRRYESVPFSILAEKCSFGTKRRFALYRTLFDSDSQIFFLDQPTTGLDSAKISFVARLIKKINETKTFVVVTHQPEIAKLANKVILLSKKSYFIDFKIEKGLFIKTTLKKKALLSVINKYNANIKIIYLDLKEGIAIYKMALLNHTDVKTALKIKSALAKLDLKKFNNLNFYSKLIYDRKTAVCDFVDLYNRTFLIN